MRTRIVLASILGIALVLLCGCTGVPSNSSPQVVVNQIGGSSQAGDLTISPPQGADPRTIVSGFLNAAATDDPHHTAARSFLTPEARTRWQDTTVTVLDDFKISNPLNGTVIVSGRQVGTVSATGTYRADPVGDGTGGTAVPSSFAMKEVNGQWRIDAPPPGVLLTVAEFERLYVQRLLYFYDLGEQHLVPDPRFTAIVDPALLANWLMTQLVAGPRPELQNAVTTEFPAQLDPAHVTVTVGSVSSVDLPGASQLDTATRNRLAAQLAATLVQVSTIGELTILDTGRAVTIQKAGGTQFSAGDFQGAVAPPISTPALYYLRGGGVVDESGHPVGGQVGNGTYGLSSAAIASSGSPDLRVAGVSGSGSAAQLLVGTVGSGLHHTGVRGRLSRPTWAPGVDEVWVGDGPTVLRCGTTGNPVAVPLSLTNGTVTGSITALRLSPEGSRVAMVIADPDGSAQVWVGSVIRNAAQVRVDSLEPITPPGIVIRDVAWNDALKLFVIGRAIATGDTNIYEVQVDGSLWTPRNVTNLPYDPDTITVAQNEAAWVSAGTTVWVQRAGSWASPGVGPTSGTNPMYLE